MLASAALLIPLSMLLLGCLNLLDHLPGIKSLWSSKIFPSIRQDAVSNECTHNYTIELLSVDPLIIYINNFLRDEEIEHLISANATEFTHSSVLDKQHNAIVDTSVRSSTSSYFALSDPVASCLSKRMTELLGNVQHTDIEPIQIVKYEGSEQFRLHVDWVRTPLSTAGNKTRSQREYNRSASIFAYLESNCTGGETYFPEVTGVSPSADGTKFSRTDGNKGLVIKPKRGNAVFWTNLHVNGSGDERVAHAGLPVRSGRKIGINIWSLYFYDTPMMGGY